MRGIGLIRTEDGFKAADEISAEKIAHYKLGAFCTADIVQPRDPTFHRRAFKLLQFGYAHWSPPKNIVVDGIGEVEIERNFEVYRKGVTKLAGYYDVCVQIDGSIVLEPKSLSYGSMEEGEFREWFRAVKDVLWNQIFHSIEGFTEESFDDAVAEFMRF